MKKNKNSLNALFDKAESAFKRCIKKDENVFLQDEIDFPVSSIKTQRKSVASKSDKDNPKRFTIEVEILLLSDQNKVIGSYTYVEDQNEVQIDDYLVFD